MYQSGDMLAEVKALLQENKHFYEFAQLRGVYSKIPDGWKNVLTTIILMKKGRGRENDERLDYKELLLIKKAIDLEDVKIIIEKLLSEELIFKEGSCRFHITHMNKSFYPSNDFFDWPGKLITLEGEKPNISWYQPLVEYSKPLFRDTYHAISKWVDLQPFHGDRDARLGGVLIFLPEYRAKINNIHYHDGKLSVKVDFNIPQFGEIRCKALITTSTGEERNMSADFKKDEVVFPVGSLPVNTYICLLTPEESILDYYEETPFRHSGRVRFIAKEGPAEISEIQALIRGGENDQVEFKERVEKDKTKRDLVKTAVAFANTKGGTIFIGVNDNAEIIGIDSELQENENNESRVKDRYLNILRDNLKKAFKFSLEFRKVTNRTILIIHVPESEFKPCSTIDNEIFIRVGGTDRRPDPDTELESLFPKSKSLYR